MRPIDPRMFRAPLRGLLAAGASVAALAWPRPADAAGAWLASADLEPVEQRLAVALAPGRTTVWTSLRFVAPAGPVAFVLPVPAGASVDRSSDAWLEALDLATAPRVFPPPHASPACPGVGNSWKRPSSANRSTFPSNPVTYNVPSGASANVRT